MKFQIKHECRGRIRVQAVQQRMTLEQADMLEAWLLTLPQVERASVHERTRCAVIEYQGDRQDLLRALAGFSYQNHALAELVPPTAAGRSIVPMRKSWWVWSRLRQSAPCFSGTAADSLRCCESCSIPVPSTPVSVANSSM